MVPLAAVVAVVAAVGLVKVVGQKETDLVASVQEATLGPLDECQPHGLKIRASFLR